MLKAKRRRLRDEQESMDVDPVVRTHPPSTSPMTFTLIQGMNCSSQSPHPTCTKITCVDLAAASVRVLKEEDPVSVDMSTHDPNNEVSKLDPPAAVKRPPARYVASGAANLMSNDTDGVDQEDQDDTEEEIIRRDDRVKGDGTIAEDETNDGLLNDDEVDGQAKTDSHLELEFKK